MLILNLNRPWPKGLYRALRNTPIFLGGVIFALNLFHAPFAKAIESTQALEETFFHRSYPLDTQEVRLGRLEMFLFGDEKPGPIQDRYSNLLQAAIQNKVSLESKPVLDSDTDPRFQQSNVLQGLPSETTEGYQQPPEVIGPDATDYPTVTAMENRSFGRAFDHEDILVRLERLENHVFKHPFPQNPLAERVDQLTLRILPEDPLSQEMRLNGLPPQAAAEASRLPQTGEQMASQNLAIYGQLASLELRLIGMSYGGESLTTRLNRLEGKVFGQFQAGSIDDRFARLQERASGTASGYSNPMSSNPNAGLRIPRWPPEDNVQPRPSNIPYSTPSGTYTGSRQSRIFEPGVQPLLGGANASQSTMEQITGLELDLFGRSFEGINLNNRITNLEIKAFNQTFPGLYLDQRLAQLTQHRQQRP
jgi:hypothetical protein